MSEFTNTRRKILDEIRLEMHGPFSSDRSFEIRSEELDQTPNSIYSCGILFPQETLIEDLTSQETLDDSDTTSDTENTQENSDNSNTRQRDNSSEDDNYFDDLNLSSQLKPSSISISFRVENTKSLSFRVNYATYQKLGEDRSVAARIFSQYSDYEEFIRWWEQNLDLTYKTMRNYLNALNFLSEDLRKQQIIAEELHQITDPSILENAKDTYFSNEENRLFNISKHSRFSASLAVYIKYRQETLDETTNTQERANIENVSGGNEGSRLKIDSKIYKRKQNRFFQKIELGSRDNFREKFTVSSIENVTVLECVCQVRKSIDNIRTITISLVNKHQKQQNSTSPTSHHFFQPEIIVLKPKEGNFVPIEQHSRLTSDIETKIENLQYRNTKSFARGHNCSGDWLESTSNEGEKNNNDIFRVFSNLFPSYEVLGTAQRNQSNTKFSYYAQINKPLDEQKISIVPRLKTFVGEYIEWINSMEQKSNILEQLHTEASEVVIERCRRVYKRITEGINYLEENPNALKAFIIANRAIWMQQCHFNLKNRDNIEESEFVNPSINLDEHSDRGWRAFQLAFLLMNIKTLPNFEETNPQCKEDVELIWFPTGGGKTEAYLGLSAFTIVYNRLIDNPNEYGVEVLMRYTLRLLTSQQFQRASTLICALDYIKNNEDLSQINAEEFKNKKDVTIGLWVGQSLTPNVNSDAVAKRKNIKPGSNPFQILSCPWCKTSLENPLNLQSPTYDGYKIVGLKSDAQVVFRCPERKCNFSNKDLPIKVVDDQLYDNPPTILIGTVDKFAQLAWKNEPKKFFGVMDDIKPPSLIIQDELHLISGPLGSIVGHYEYLVRILCEKAGFSPKIIASTATIKAAESQVNNLYLNNVNLFPPNGIDIGDNFFSQPDEAGKGRLYIGVFASATPSIIIAQRNLVTPLTIFPSSLHFSSDEYIEKKPLSTDSTKFYESLKKNISNKYVDPYGTILWYFNTLRELGYASSLIYSDISPYISNILKRKEISYAFKKKFFNTKELTSRVNENDIASIEKQLNIPWIPSPDYTQIEKDKVPIDILLATNMISVGVDIPRLALMVITGQPKNTSEYIQASSRVGRGNLGSGLVFTLYNQSRSRDRSHFENFKSFHQSLYRYVEPTSVTPLSPKSRERCLPALVVGVARHVCDVEKPADLNEEIKSKIFDYLSNYINKFSGSDQDQVINEIEEVFNTWENHLGYFVEDAQWGGMVNRPEDNSLLSQFNSKSSEDQFEKIGLLMSMRNVDTVSEAKIIPRQQLTVV